MNVRTRLQFELTNFNVWDYQFSYNVAAISTCIYEYSYVHARTDICRYTVYRVRVPYILLFCAMLENPWRGSLIFLMTTYMRDFHHYWVVEKQKNKKKKTKTKKKKTISQILFQIWKSKKLCQWLLLELNEIYLKNAVTKCVLAY